MGNFFEGVWEYIKNNGKEILLFLTSWYFGLRIFSIGIANLDLANPNQVEPYFLVFIAVGIFLFLLPFFRRVKVGNLELEREIEQTRNELVEFKQETRSNIAVMTTQISAVANISNQNQVMVYVPGYEEAKAVLKERTTDDVEIEAEAIRNRFLNSQDSSMAVLSLRVNLEYILRRLLEKRVSVQDASTGMKFLSLYQLTNQFLKHYPDYKYLEGSFNYVREVGNAAAHAQKFTESQSEETLGIGSRLIAILEDLADEEGITLDRA